MGVLTVAARPTPAHAAARHVVDSIRRGYLYGFNRRDNGHAVVTFTPESGGPGVTVYFVPTVSGGVTVTAWDHATDTTSVSGLIPAGSGTDAITTAVRAAIRSVTADHGPI